MLEFLKKYSNTLYNLGMDVECNLNAPSPFTSMRMLLENLLNLCYKKFKNQNDDTVSELTLDEMLLDVDFVEWFIGQYSIDIRVNTKSIIEGEKHLTNKKAYYGVPKFELTKKCFERVFILSARCYARNTKNIEPTWNDLDYDNMYNQLVCIKSRNQIEQQIADEIKETEAKCNLSFKKFKEYKISQSKIDKDLSALIDGVTNQEIVDEGNKLDSINVKLNVECNKLAIIKTKQLESNEIIKKLAEKIENHKIRLKFEAQSHSPERENLQLNLDELNKKYSDEIDTNKKIVEDISFINDAIEKLTKEKETTINTIGQLKISLVDKTSFDYLTNQLNQVTIDLKNAYTEYVNLNDKLKGLNKKLFISDSKFEKEHERFQASKFIQYELLFDKEKLLEKVPRCKKCGSLLEPYKSKYGDKKIMWKCPKYPVCKEKMIYYPNLEALGESILNLNSKEEESYIPTYP